ncbi:hypothetical protein Rhopal_004905-T1 [Rhodotorula paludigena]|uniref:Signal peptidase complex subunit 1 n=1 Tax=Rhodotorula paludigena TaxID=86838 RepID=A0AAV5GH34_9BASI|nr:hypothetical protein Rhopal_004905-T1 [Rhodotorula paludigena]
MDSIHAQLDKCKASLEGKIDFVGQDLAEKRARYILWTSAVVAFLVGFSLQSLKFTFIVFGLGFLTTLGVRVPATLQTTLN